MSHNIPPEGAPDSSADDDGRFDGPPEREAVRGEIMPHLPPMDTTALAAVVRSEVDSGLSWAVNHPRSVDTFKKELADFVLQDVATAEKMYYSLRRGGKAITGPSVRMAELAAELYGNLKAGARLLSTQGEYAIAEGVAHDLERNTLISRTVARRLTNKEGVRYNDDMIVMTANAAGSLALRNAIVSVIGKRYLDPMVDRARKFVADSGAGSMQERRATLLDWWGKHGVSEARVLATLGRKGRDDITSEDIADARGFARAIGDNEATLDEVFPPVDSVIERLRARRAAASQSAPVGPERVDGSGRALWTALPAGDPSRVEAARAVAEMEAGPPTRIGLTMKRAKNERAFTDMTVSEVSVFYEVWKTVKVAGA